MAAFHSAPQARCLLAWEAVQVHPGFTPLAFTFLVSSKGGKPESASRSAIVTDGPLKLFMARPRRK